MSKQLPNRPSAAKREDEDRVHVKESYFRHVDQLERWRQEHEHKQAVENKLGEVSNLTYEAVEYDSLLVRVPWEERPLPNYDYLLDEARLATEKKFFYPVAIRIGILLVLIIILFIGSNLTALWIAGTGGTAVLASLYVISKNRQQKIEMVLFETQVAIEERLEREQKLNEEAKAQHENKEDERITAIESLLAGEIPAVFSRLDMVLSNLDLPFFLNVDISIYNQIMLVQVFLPAKTIIPTQLCTLMPSGRVSYQDKEVRSVNKQYLELCAAIVMKIMSVVYANIPTVDRSYVHGISKEGLQDDCVIAMSLDREALVTACNSANGLTAIQQAQAQFEVNTALILRPLKVERPAEWGDVETKYLHSIHIKLEPQNTYSTI